MPFGPGRYTRGNPQAVPGVYRYVDKKTGRVLYKGQAVNLRRRYRQHLRGDPPAFNPSEWHFDWKEQKGGGVRERLEKEEEKIRQHKPPMNKNKGGGGRTPLQSISDLFKR